MSLFEVEGWAVASKITAVKKKKKEDKRDAKASEEPKIGKGKKKVNAEQIQDLYEEHIEGKPKPVKRIEKKAVEEKAPVEKSEKSEKSEIKPKKPQQQQKQQQQQQQKAEGGADVQKPAKKNNKRKHKDDQEEEKPEVKAKQTKTEKHKTEKPKPEAGSAASVGLGPKTKLTVMQQKMMEKLAGSRFRWINEQLYTTTSAEAVKIMKNQPEMFDEYHTGFRNQVQSWPQNPVDTFVNQMKERLEKPIGAPGGLPGDKDGRIVIADMGCGEAQLAVQVKALEKKMASAPAKKGKHARFFKGKKAKFEIHSFDLKKANDRITVADITNVPLPDESAHIVVFCLALMGTNFLDFIKEGLRILRPNGEIWIAEIKSRFVDNDTTEFVKILKSLGLFHKNTDDTNKMFIRLEFFKPNKEYIENRDNRQQTKQRFIDEDDESLEDRRKRDAEGNWLLKPCIYKRR